MRKLQYKERKGDNMILMAGTPIVDLSSFVAALTASITPAQILEILAQVVAVGMAFFLMWLGVRKATKAFTSAVSKGTIRI